MFLVISNHYSLCLHKLDTKLSEVSPKALINHIKVPCSFLLEREDSLHSGKVNNSFVSSELRTTVWLKKNYTKCIAK